MRLEFPVNLGKLMLHKRYSQDKGKNSATFYKSVGFALIDKIIITFVHTKGNKAATTGQIGWRIQADINCTGHPRRSQSESFKAA